MGDLIAFVKDKDNIQWVILGAYIILVPIIAFVVNLIDPMNDTETTAGIAIFWPLVIPLIILFGLFYIIVKIPADWGESLGFKRKYKHKNKNNSDDISEEEFYDE